MQINPLQELLHILWFTENQLQDKNCHICMVWQNCTALPTRWMTSSNPLKCSDKIGVILIYQKYLMIGSFLI